ncbi:MAG: L,D-transpeptidase family protein [Pseudomonadota bacterium]
MHRRKLMLGAASVASLGACSSGPSIRRYSGPEVTYVVVNKEKRRMYLLHDTSILKAYDIQLGFAPRGHKRFKGDGKTPEGLYRIDRRNPNSQFHLSLGISYPNAEDIKRAAAEGKSPGGDIFIHGQENPFRADHSDWTWGCIAVKNPEIEEIYAMVGTGTPIALNP